MKFLTSSNCNKNLLCSVGHLDKPVVQRTFLMLIVIEETFFAF